MGAYNPLLVQHCSGVQVGPECLVEAAEAQQELSGLYLPALVLLHICAVDTICPAHALVAGQHPPQIAVGERDQTAAGRGDLPLIAPTMSFDEHVPATCTCLMPFRSHREHGLFKMVATRAEDCDQV